MQVNPALASKLLYERNHVMTPKQRAYQHYNTHAMAAAAAAAHAQHALPPTHALQPSHAAAALHAQAAHQQHAAARALANVTIASAPQPLSSLYARYTVVS